MRQNNIHTLTSFLTAILLAATLTSCNQPKASSPTQDESKPNIILFVSDDHGTDALGCYGNQVIQTPNLDKLAAEGIRFNNAYCTSASCAASRSVILTGKYGHATGSYGHVHDYHHFSTYESVKSLPVLLEQEGYMTARIGKYHVAPEEVYHFEQVLKADPRNTVEMADQCQEVLNAEQPFFLYFCTDDPHRGQPFKPEPWNTPNNFGNKTAGYDGVETITYTPDEVIVPDFLPDTKETREELAEYYQSVSRIDQGFGKLMAMLKASGKADNTIVIYISDNGIAFPGAKTTLYEPGMRLPCIVHDPTNTLKGTSTDAMVSWVDLAPTILDMAGADYKADAFHGRSFKEVLTQENPAGWDEINASHLFHEITMYYPMRVQIDKNYKLIWNIAWRSEYPFASDLWDASTWQGIYRAESEYFGKRKVKDYLFRAEFELYDLAADPGELKNLADDAAFAEVLARMKGKLKAFQKRTDDPWLIMWGHDASLQGSGVNL